MNNYVNIWYNRRKTEKPNENLYYSNLTNYFTSHR